MHWAKHDPRVVEEIDCVFIPQHVIDTERAAQEYAQALKQWAKAANNIISQYEPRSKNN